jgi:uncharacterized protein (DUF2062 family)
MGDSLITSIMLVCAVLASLAVGVLIAHWVCVAMFAMFRTHQRQVASARIAKPQQARLEAMRG